MTAPTPSTCFYIQCFGERAELVRACNEIRASYPESRIIVCFDGDRGERDSIEVLKADGNIDIVEGDRLYLFEHGGAVCQRMLELFLEKPADFLIKIDPDTRIVRPFTFWPTAERYFGGTIVMSGESISIQGGCMIFSKQLCIQLHQSGILDSDELKPPDSAWIGSAPMMYRAHVLGLTSHDWTIAYAVARLGVPVCWHPQVLSRWESLRFQDVLRYYSAAIIHPYTRDFLGVLSWKNLLRKIRNEKINDYGPISMNRQFSFKAADLGTQSLLAPVMLWLLNTVPPTDTVTIVDSPQIAKDLAGYFNECLSTSTSYADSAEASRTGAVIFAARKIRSMKGAIDYVRRALPYLRTRRAIIVDIANEPVMLLFALLIISFLGKFNFKFFFEKKRLMMTIKEGWPDRRTLVRGFFALPVAASQVIAGLENERLNLEIHS